MSAIITGSGSGIGREVARAWLAERSGAQLTLLDLDGKALHELAQDLRRGGAAVQVVVLDVCDESALAAAFQRHVDAYGTLDVAVLCAGIGERHDFLSDAAASSSSWQRVMDIDLTAVLAGTRLAARVMMRQPTGGAIVSVASAAGFFPVPAAPVYAAAKGGLVHFTRSLGPRLAEHNIRLTTVCPQYVDTPLVSKLREAPEVAKAVMGPLIDAPMLQPRQVADVVLRLAGPSAQPGQVLLLLQSGKVVDPFAKKNKLQQRAAATTTPATASSSGDTLAVTERTALTAWVAGRKLPAVFCKIVVHTLSRDFAAATRIVSVPLPPILQLPPGSLLVRRTFAGINASDINFSDGRYSGTRKEAAANLPFDAGFEAVSVVAAVAPGVTGWHVGDPVATLGDGFSEFAVVQASRALAVPRPTPEMLALLTSGLTASIALEQCGGTLSGQTVLVTAAAGGTGMFAVQLAKLAGAHVVATCSGGAKAQLLQRLGADRVISYRSEDIKAVLRAEYPRGVDVVYESVGGATFVTALDALAPRGRLIVIGMMSQYAAGWAPSSVPGLSEKLLWKSASVHGFFLLRYAKLFSPHLERLVALTQGGQLQVAVDPSRFLGLEAVADAVAHLHSGTSVGKVVVQITTQLPLLAATTAKL